MQTVSEKSYSKIFVPNNSGALRFKFEGIINRLNLPMMNFGIFAVKMIICELK